MQIIVCVFGLTKNARLRWRIDLELELTKAESEATGKAAQRFMDFSYQTLKSWSRARRVVGKAEHLPNIANSRFVVSSLSAEERSLYEELYCGRGE